jgi:hypothetical protein
MNGSMKYSFRTVKNIEELPTEVARVISPYRPIWAIIVLQHHQNSISLVSWLSRFGDFAVGTDKISEHTLALTDTYIIVVETAQDAVINKIIIPIHTIASIDLGFFLVGAYLQFMWMDGGQIRVFKLDFNSLGMEIIKGYFNLIRFLMTDEQNWRRQPGQKNGVPVNIAALPFKFQTFLSQSLLPDEEVVEVIYQPAILHSQGWFRPCLSPNRAVAVTDQSIVVIEEGENTPVSSFGIITRFIPLCRIHEIRFEHTPDATCMKLEFTQGQSDHTIDIMLDDSNVMPLYKHLKGMVIVSFYNTSSQSVLDTIG